MPNQEMPHFRFEGTPEEIRALYDRLKREFCLEDLKAFEVEEEDTVLFSNLLGELEVMAREAKEKRKSE